MGTIGERVGEKTFAQKIDYELEVVQTVLESQISYPASNNATSRFSIFLRNAARFNPSLFAIRCRATQSRIDIFACVGAVKEAPYSLEGRGKGEGRDSYDGKCLVEPFVCQHVRPRGMMGIKNHRYHYPSRDNLIDVRPGSRKRPGINNGTKA